MLHWQARAWKSKQMPTTKLSMGVALFHDNARPHSAAYAAAWAAERFGMPRRSGNWSLKQWFILDIALILPLLLTSCLDPLKRHSEAPSIHLRPRSEGRWACVPRSSAENPLLWGHHEGCSTMDQERWKAKGVYWKMMLSLVPYLCCNKSYDYIEDNFLLSAHSWRELVKIDLYVLLNFTAFFFCRLLSIPRW